MSLTKHTILTCTPTYRHMPDSATRPVREGMTLRDAIKALRAAGRQNFGDIGEMSCDLSDGSKIDVNLRDVEFGGWLMSSQRIERRNYNTYTGADQLIRTYAW